MSEEGLPSPKKQKLKRQILNFCIDDVIKNYVIVGVLFGCGQGVVFVPEIDSGKLASMNLQENDVIRECRKFLCDAKTECSYLKEAGYLKMPPESTYGNKRFVVPFHDLINCYKTSRSDCTVKSVYLKKGGTPRYTREVCYVIMVIMEEDNQDGYFSTLPSMFEEPCFEHNGCIDREGKIVSNKTHYFKIKHPFSSWDCWESLAFAFVFLIQDQLPLQCPKQFCEEVEVNHVRCTSTQPHPQTKKWVCPNLIQ